MTIIESAKKDFENLQATNPTSSHIFLKGNKNCHVLFSAPHAVSQTRNGIMKFPEPETGLICLILNKRFGVPCIIKLHNLGDDANWGDESQYKRELTELLHNKNFCFYRSSSTRKKDENRTSA